MNFFNPLKLYINQALPAVYDDSLSYLETLGKIGALLDDMVRWANELINDEIISKENVWSSYKVNEEFVAVRDSLAALENEVDALYNYAHGLINDNVTTDVNTWSSSKISGKFNDILDMINDINAKIDDMGERFKGAERIKALTNLTTILGQTNDELIDAIKINSDNFYEFLDKVGNAIVQLDTEGKAFYLYDVGYKQILRVTKYGLAYLNENGEVIMEINRQTGEIRTQYNNNTIMALNPANERIVFYHPYSSDKVLSQAFSSINKTSAPEARMELLGYPIFFTNFGQLQLGMLLDKDRQRIMLDFTQGYTEIRKITAEGYTSNIIHADNSKTNLLFNTDFYIGADGEGCYYTNNGVKKYISSLQEISDGATSETTTWSSEKIKELLDTVNMAISNLSTYAENLINDNLITTTNTWSSNKIATAIESATEINDSTTSDSSTWSSEKIAEEIESATEIDDSITTTDTTWSSVKIENEIEEATADHRKIINKVTTTTTSNPIIINTDTNGNTFSEKNLTIYIAFEQPVTSNMTLSLRINGLVSGYVQPGGSGLSFRILSELPSGGVTIGKVVLTVEDDNTLYITSMFGTSSSILTNATPSTVGMFNNITDINSISITSTVNFAANNKITVVRNGSQNGLNADLINNNATLNNRTWSSNKIATSIAGLIDDNETVIDKTWSSTKIDSKITDNVNALIDDTATTASKAWSSSKIYFMLNSTTNALISDTSTATNKTWSSEKISNEIANSHDSIIDDGGTTYSTTWSSEKIGVEITDSRNSIIDDGVPSYSNTWSSEKIQDEIDAGVTLANETADNTLNNYYLKARRIRTVFTFPANLTSIGGFFDLSSYYNVIKGAQVSVINNINIDFKYSMQENLQDGVINGFVWNMSSTLSSTNRNILINIVIFGGDE